MSSQVPPPPNPQYQYQQPPAAPQKKSSVLKWVLIILGAIILLGGIAVVGTGYFVYQKVKQAGIDPGLAQRNPALAAAKVVVAMNPEIEMVEVDEDAGTMTIREKKTGKTVTVNFEDIKEGRISFEGADGEQATMEIGKEGMEVRTNEGTFTAGEGLQDSLPSWLPVYEGAKVEGSFSMKGRQTGASVAMTTSDSPAKVADFYEKQLKAEGFKVDRTSVNRSGGPGSMEIVSFEGAKGKGSATVVADDNNKARINLAYEQK